MCRIPYALIAVLLLIGCSDSSDSTRPVDVLPGQELVGYRASLYETQYPTERKNLNGSHTLLNVGLPRGVTSDEIALEIIDMPFPVLLYTRDAD